MAGIAPRVHLVENGALGNSGGGSFAPGFASESGSEARIPEDRYPGSSHGTPVFILQAAIRIRRHAAGVRYSSGIWATGVRLNFHELGETNGLA